MQSQRFLRLCLPVPTTAIGRGANDTTGIALAGVYQLRIPIAMPCTVEIVQAPWSQKNVRRAELNLIVGRIGFLLVWHKIARVLR